MVAGFYFFGDCMIAVRVCRPSALPKLRNVVAARFPAASGPVLLHLSVLSGPPRTADDAMHPATSLVS
ncbi:hypothetical protein C0J52_02293 [Blattella germanica]|nr:hypothetical protein C0J52_02293 [Blattella germanica]